MNRTVVIDCYGGPGTGKSTSAAFLYYLLKKRGYNAELVREYVKDWAWEKRAIGDFDQFYFMGKQIRKESMLYGKVDFIVTDSPIAMNYYYAMKYTPEVMANAVRASVRAYYELAAKQGHVHIHAFLKREKAYNPSGRFQTEEQAKAMDGELRIALGRGTELQPGLELFVYDKIGTSEEDLTELLDWTIEDYWFNTRLGDPSFGKR